MPVTFPLLITLVPNTLIFSGTMYQYSGIICALIACFYAPEASAFVSGGGGAILRTYSRHSGSSLACSGSPRHAYTRMVTGQEGGVAQTRAGIIEIMWKSALTAGAAQALTVSSAFAADESVTPSGLKIRKLVQGKGPVAAVGDLIAIRFKGNYGNYEFDNILNADEPYYMRAGVETLVPGVEEALLMMRVGDRWELTCPANLAFGDKGRPPSPGRPRIPPGATVEYTVELVALPGKEDDILDLLDEPLTGPAFDSA